MDKPKYFDEFASFLPENVELRIEEVEKELKELKDYNRSNKLTCKDIEDISDNYQLRLERNYAISELNDELECLKYKQWLNSANNK